MERKPIKFLQLNLGRSRAATTELAHIVHRLGADVCLLQEPYSFRGRVAGLGSTARVFQAASGSQGPSAVIVVLDPTLEVYFHASISSTHCVCTEIYCDGKSVGCISAYFQFSDSIGPHLGHLTTALDRLQNLPLVIGADVNAKSTLWGPTQDCRGLETEDFIAMHDLVVVNDLRVHQLLSATV